MADACRSADKATPGSARGRRHSEKIGQLNAKVKRQRRDTLHKLSRRLVEQNDLLVLEALTIRSMVRPPQHSGNPWGSAAQTRLNQSINDAGWGTLDRMLAYKAEDAGRQVIHVDPRYTSQTCPECGHRSRGNRPSQAVFRCERCGHSGNADVVAAVNILRAGLAQRASVEASI